MSEGPRRANEITDRLRARVVATVLFWHAVIERARIAEVAFLAAAVAYYAFLSLLPVLLLILAIGSALGGEALADAIVVAAGDLLTPTGRGLVHDALENAAGRTGATIVSVLLLIWSMLRVFRALDIAFQMVYGTGAPASLKDQIRDGAVAVLGVGTGITVMFGVGAFISAFNLDPVLDLLGILVLPAVLTVVFLPLYYAFPDVKLRVGDVLPGTLFAAVGWTVLQAGFQIYAANAGQYQAYGVLGGVLLLVIWFYLAAIVLLLGAIVNVVLSDRAAPPTTPVETSAVGPPSRRSVERRAGSEGGFAASSDRQLQQSPGTQGKTTQMVSEDDDSHRDGTEQSHQTESGSDRDEGDSSSRKERDRPARNESKRLVDSDEPVRSREPIGSREHVDNREPIDSDEHVDSREYVDSDGIGLFRSDGGSPVDSRDDSSAQNDDDSSVRGRDEESQNEDDSRSGEDLSGDVSPIEDELMNAGGSPGSDRSPSDDGRSSVDSDEGAHGERDDENFGDHTEPFSGDRPDNDDRTDDRIRDDGNERARSAGTAASGEEDVPSWKGGGSSRYDDDDSSGAEGDTSPGGNGSIGAGSAANDGEDNDDGVDPSGAPDITKLQREVDRLRSELDEFERDVESRTVERPKLESELKRYVRKRMRRGHARGWGPYLVLLYGTILTLGGFYWLDGIYAIAAMLILALSTLGLYVLFVLFGIGLNVVGVPYRAIDAIRRRRK